MGHDICNKSERSESDWKERGWVSAVLDRPLADLPLQDVHLQPLLSMFHLQPSANFRPLAGGDDDLSRAVGERVRSEGKRRLGVGVGGGGRVGRAKREDRVGSNKDGQTASKRKRGAKGIFSLSLLLSEMERQKETH